MGKQRKCCDLINMLQNHSCQMSKLTGGQSVWFMLVKLGVCVLFWEGKKTKKQKRPHYEQAGGRENTHLTTYRQDLGPLQSHHWCSSQETIQQPVTLGKPPTDSRIGSVTMPWPHGSPLAKEGHRPSPHRPVYPRDPTQLNPASREAPSLHQGAKASHPLAISKDLFHWGDYEFALCQENQMTTGIT